MRRSLVATLSGGLILLLSVWVAAGTPFGWISAATGYCSTALILLMTLLGYRRHVEKFCSGLPASSPSGDAEDDPYELWQDEPSEPDDTADTDIGPKKSRHTGGLKRSILHAGAALSLYRIAAYAVFIFCFMVLLRTERLELDAYFSGIFAASFLVVLRFWFSNRRSGSSQPR